MSRSQIILDVALRNLARAVVGLSVIFLAGPAIVVLTLSVSGEAFIHFPPDEWGLRQFDSLAHDAAWRAALGESLTVALFVAALAVLVAVPAVFAVHRTRLPFAGALALVALTPLMIPQVSYAVGMYGVMSKLDLIGTRTGLVLAHATVTFPLAIILVGTAMLRVPQEYELVALTLGASRFAAWRSITVPLLIPAILSAALFAFVTSFDEPVFVSFLGGTDVVTLPKAILDSVRFGVDPVITAIAALLMAATALLLGAAIRLQGRR